jgi:hypothetical protein
VMMASRDYGGQPVDPAVDTAIEIAERIGI